MTGAASIARDEEIEGMVAIARNFTVTASGSSVRVVNMNAPRTAVAASGGPPVIVT